MEFIAYALGWSGFAIEPADHRRDWMDATTGQFAYRCLPLVMANQAGWVIRCPVDFEAVWNGETTHGRGIELFGDEDAQPYLGTMIVDHFGEGILTFSLPYLFRTPPGYGLLVRGATNFWVPGAHPLDGLVETDWLESTFTMNWRLTDVGRRVAFKKGAPICQLQPYPMALLESFQTRMVPIAEAPEAEAALERWAEKRAAFIASPERQLKDWQKDYFQGKTQTGDRAAGHKTRFSLGSFEPSGG